MEELPEEIIDKIKSLWQSGWKKSDILKHLQESYPTRRWYFMKISRLVDTFKPESRLEQTSYQDINDELENLRDYLYSIGITGEQHRSITRRLYKIRDAVRRGFIEKATNDLKLEKVSNYLQIDYVEQVLLPLCKKYKGLDVDIRNATKRFWREHLQEPYYNDPELEEEDLASP